MTVHLVSHTHWDREWYRPWQAFRARLVDTVDLVLGLAAADPGYRFVLDGQTVTLDDYAEIRPDRTDELASHVRRGAIAIGPWYVQPDSLLPSGEAHVRNLLVGREVGERFGPVSTAAYVPDSFGHPAQFPQLFAGFGLDGFVYWRGNGREWDDLGPRWVWRAPDGSRIRALVTTEGYYSAARLDPVADDGRDLDETVDRLATTVGRLRAAGEEPVLLMNGFDHTRPDRQTRTVVEALVSRLGEPVTRSLLDDVVAAAPPVADLPEHQGPLLGARLSNLLPGVWSARMPIKLANRRAEARLEQWAEPWAALGATLGLADERAALGSAWRSLLQNQAHDSICGCSVDATHERMGARFDDAARLASETTDRVLHRLAGRAAEREVPWSDTATVTVFNPSPHPVTDVVRVPLDLEPALALALGEPQLHPLATALLSGGLTVDGRPARLVPSAEPHAQWVPDQSPMDVELVARDVPAFGSRRYTLEAGAAAEDEVDAGRVVATDEVTVEVEAGGTMAVTLGGDRWTGLFGIEDVGDRGDSYDHDPVGEPITPAPVEVGVERRRAPNGVQALTVVRRFELPARLDDDRDSRTAETVDTTIALTCRLVPGVDRVDTRVTVEDPARDHRMRLLFPTGGPVDRFEAATTFDVATRSTARPDDTGWLHPAPATFCHQGWVSAGGLTVAAGGLPEAEVTEHGVVAVTLVRAVGWLARFDLHTRPLPAGPVVEAPGAQVTERFEATVSLWDRRPPAETARRARAAEAGLTGVLGGPDPVAAPDRPLLALAGDAVVLSALKPAEDGDGLVIRVLNPTGQPARAEIRPGFDLDRVEAVRLDEEPEPRGPGPVWADATITLDLPAHGLRSVRLVPA